MIDLALFRSRHIYVHVYHRYGYYHHVGLYAFLLTMAVVLLVVAAIAWFPTPPPRRRRRW